MDDYNLIIKFVVYEYKVVFYYGYWEVFVWIWLMYGNDCYVIVIVVYGIL